MFYLSYLFKLLFYSLLVEVLRPGDVRSTSDSVSPDRLTYLLTCCVTVLCVCNCHFKLLMFLYLCIITPSLTHSLTYSLTYLNHSYKFIQASKLSYFLYKFCLQWTVFFQQTLLRHYSVFTYLYFLSCTLIFCLSQMCG